MVRDYQIAPRLLRLVQHLFGHIDSQQRLMHFVLGPSHDRPALSYDSCKRSGAYRSITSAISLIFIILLHYLKRRLYFQRTISDGRLFAPVLPSIMLPTPKSSPRRDLRRYAPPKRYTEVSGSFAYPVGPIAVAVRNVTAPSESEAKAKCTRLPYFKTSV